MNAKTVMSHFVLNPVSDFIILIRSMYLLIGGGRSVMQHLLTAEALQMVYQLY
jgi:hypothetical protein